MPLVAVAALVAPAVPTATATTTPAPASKAKPAFPEYVALGDSWTADVVILNTDGFPATEHAPLGCAQSHRNYPKLVAKAIGAKTFRDASCGSATTDDFSRPQTGLPTGGANPPQFNRLTRSTDLVTVGIGGNDAGVAAAGMDCLNVLPVETPLEMLPDLPVPVVGGLLTPFGGCKKKYTKGGVDRLARNIERSEPKVVRALKRIHRISPDARVLLVDYMRVIPDHACYPLVPATDKDMRYIKAKFDQLNAMLKRAARKGGAELVSTAARTRGHHLCTGARTRYAETLGLSVNDLAIGVPAHPNSAGARAQAASVLDHLRRHPG
ncbi:MAG TPA: SGNH/GDSL hydrolase family protein [Nocardioides sp.]|nr:SGNH/GDSL hydrolase family protein [Nocardioides sp.]